MDTSPTLHRNLVLSLCGKAMFLRFVVTQIDNDSHQPQGLFVVSHELLDSGDLSPEESAQIRRVLRWFNLNLPSPSSIGARVIFWFKSDADQCLEKMWELKAVLEYHGYLVEVQKVRQLGNIVYEDEFQVAAFPSRKDLK